MKLRILAGLCAVALVLGLAWAIAGLMPARSAAFARAVGGGAAKPGQKRGSAPAPLDIAAPKSFDTASFALG
jgi:hypothetical protein